MLISFGSFNLLIHSLACSLSRSFDSFLVRLREEEREGWRKGEDDLKG